MQSPRRGTGLFNILMGFNDPVPVVVPKPAPPIELMNQQEALKRGLAKGAELWLDGRVFVVMFWPRPDTPYLSSYDNQMRRANGCKFFDFQVTTDPARGTFTESGMTTLDGAVIWTPESTGTLEMQIMLRMLDNTYYWRNHTLSDYAKFCDKEQIDEYIELGWNFCSRCAQFFRRIEMSPDTQRELTIEVDEMCDREGTKQY